MCIQSLQSLSAIHPSKAWGVRTNMKCFAAFILSNNDLSNCPAFKRSTSIKTYINYCNEENLYIKFFMFAVPCILSIVNELSKDWPTGCQSIFCNLWKYPLVFLTMPIQLLQRVWFLQMESKRFFVKRIKYILKPRNACIIFMRWILLFISQTSFKHCSSTWINEFLSNPLDNIW